MQWHKAIMRLKAVILLFVCISLLSYVSAQSPPGEEHKFGGQKAVNDAEHIKQHLNEKIDVNESELTEEQRRFHYFNMHDLNRDNLIDGNEIIKAMVHDHTGETGAEGRPGPQAGMDETVLENMVDSVLSQIDVNNDGFIDYAEYTRNQA